MKSIKTIWCLVFLCLLLKLDFLFAQTFNFEKFRQEINMAEYEFMYKKNYSKALSAYLNAGKYASAEMKYPDSNTCIDIAQCHLNLKDTAKAIEYLKLSVKGGNTFLDEQVWLKNMFSEKSWNMLMREFPKMKDEVLKEQKDKKGYIDGAKLEAIDQFVRINIVGRFPKAISNEILRITDSCNIALFKNLVDKNLISSHYFLIYHLYDENDSLYFNYFDSIFKKEVYAGTMDPHVHAFWYDRQLIHTRQLPNQLYGEMRKYETKEIYPIENIEFVDERRRKIGLGSLLEFSQMYQLKLPKEYKIKK